MFLIWLVLVLVVMGIGFISLPQPVSLLVDLSPDGQGSFRVFLPLVLGQTIMFASLLTNIFVCLSTCKHICLLSYDWKKDVWHCQSSVRVIKNNLYVLEQMVMSSLLS